MVWIFHWSFQGLEGFSLTQEIGTGQVCWLFFRLGSRGFSVYWFGLFKDLVGYLTFGFHWMTGSTIQRLTIFSLLHNLFDYWVKSFDFWIVSPDKAKLEKDK